MQFQIALKAVSSVRIVVISEQNGSVALRGSKMRPQIDLIVYVLNVGMCDRG